MKIAFFGTKNYDKKYFGEISKKFNHEIEYLKPRLSPKTALMLSNDKFDAVCVFVNDDVCRETIEVLAKEGIKYILLRCAGFNNVDLIAAKEYNIKVARVPSYSPEAVAEHAMTLAMAANRRIHKAYNKVRDNDYSLVGLSGKNLFEKTAGIVGTGKIGLAMIRLCKGFGMDVIAFDPYPNYEIAKEMGFDYVCFDELLERSHLISLHCPLFDKTKHMINKYTINQMKQGVILVNTSRGGLIDTEDLIDGIKANKFHAVALDVYEEESGLVFDDLSDTILEHTTTARLLSFPNVILTSHQGFFTEEALESIAQTTLENANTFETNTTCMNIVE